MFWVLFRLGSRSIHGWFSVYLGRVLNPLSVGLRFIQAWVSIYLGLVLGCDSGCMQAWDLSRVGVGPVQDLFKVCLVLA